MYICKYIYISLFHSRCFIIISFPSPLPPPLVQMQWCSSGIFPSAADATETIVQGPLMVWFNELHPPNGVRVCFSCVFIQII